MMSEDFVVWHPSTGGMSLDAIDELDRRFAPDRPQRNIPHRTVLPGQKSAGKDADRIDVVLYVSPNSINCGRATAALQGLLLHFPGEPLRVRIVDIAQDVDGASEDRVLFTPTLIVTDRQQRKTRVLGDLSNTTVLWELLVAAGVEPL